MHSDRIALTCGLMYAIMMAIVPLKLTGLVEIELLGMAAIMPVHFVGAIAVGTCIYFISGSKHSMVWTSAILVGSVFGTGMAFVCIFATPYPIVFGLLGAPCAVFAWFLLELCIECFREGPKPDADEPTPV